MRHERGFTFVELLIAAAIVLLVAGGLFSIVAGGPPASRARAAAIDIQQRLRAASEAIGESLAVAGSGPANGVMGQPLGSACPAVLPYVVGPAGDAPGSARSDGLTILATPPNRSGTTLAGAWSPAGGPAGITISPGCPAADPSCGFRPDDDLLILDGRGQADVYRVAAVAGPLLTLAPWAASGRDFPAGSFVVPASIERICFKAGAAAQGGQVVTGNAGGPDVPLVDHVVSLSFTLLAEPRPPVLTGGAGPPSADYGPSPPPPLVDDPRDTWPAGENCTFSATPGGQASRLPSLGPGTLLVPLPTTSLTDGPWCPDATSPARYDADLLRVRAVRVVLRLEASSGEARGSDPLLFAHPGSSRDRSAAAADQQLTFDIVPRAMGSRR